MLIAGRVACIHIAIVRLTARLTDGGQLQGHWRGFLLLISVEMNTRGRQSRECDGASAAGEGGACQPNMRGSETRQVSDIPPCTPRYSYRTTRLRPHILPRPNHDPRAGETLYYLTIDNWYYSLTGWQESNGAKFTWGSEAYCSDLYDNGGRRLSHDTGTYSAGSCPTTCYNVDCDYWVEADGDTCAELESIYSCDCAGCACNDGSCPDTCFGYSCDTWENAETNSYTCAENEADGCDCGGCACASGGGGGGATDDDDYWEEYNANFDFAYDSCFEGGLEVNDGTRSFWLCSLPSDDTETCTDLHFSDNEDPDAESMFWKLERLDVNDAGTEYITTTVADGGFPDHFECVGETFPTAEPTTATPTTTASQCYTLKMMDS